MKLKLYQIDAFTDAVFGGNPAAVCPLDTWLDDDIMQSIAAENNLSETAFFVPYQDGFAIRWFTPLVEVPLCGHATLASAYVIFEELGYVSDVIKFYSASGVLLVKRLQDQYQMDFPKRNILAAQPPLSLAEAFGVMPIEIVLVEHASLVPDCLLRFEDETIIANLKPNIGRLLELPYRAFIVTAETQQVGVDFVSRMFAPRVGIHEDPVTGAAHCALVPFWAQKLHKTEFTARQISKRGGILNCQLHGTRVYLSGKAVKYLEGYIFIGGKMMNARLKEQFEDGFKLW